MDEVTRRDLMKASAVAAGVALAATVPALAVAADEKRSDAKEAPEVSSKTKLATGPKKWHQLSFPSLANLVNYVNAAPAQGAGEVVVVSATSGGSVVALIYL